MLLAEGSDKTIRDYHTPLRLYRVNTDGSLDNSFVTPQVGWSISHKVRTGENNSIYWLGELMQASSPDHFTLPLIKLKPNGSLDSAVIPLPSYYYISDFEVLPDNKLVICGQKIFQNDSVNFVMRLNPDLSIDNTFSPVALYYNLKHINFDGNERIIVAGEPKRYLRFETEQIQNVAVLKNSGMKISTEQRTITNIVDTLVIQSSSSPSIETTFTIRNTGNTDISLLDASHVMLSGSEANQFSVELADNKNVIGKQDSLQFVLKFTPRSEGLKTVKISIPYSNGIEQQYTFIAGATGTNITTPVNEIPRITDKVVLFANPVKNATLYVKTEARLKSYEIINLEGIVVQRGSLQNSSNIYTIHLKKSHHGMFSVKLRTKNGEITRKIIVP